MKATRIIAIRHGETAWNVDTRIQGQLDIPLNETGRWQAERAAEALTDQGIDHIYASDLARAWETAHRIGQKTGLIIQPEQGLRERGFGEFEGMTFAEIEAQRPEQSQRWRQRDPHFAPPGGGESLLDFRDRVINTTLALAARHAGEHIVLVAHGGVMDVLYRAATGQDLQAPRTWHLGNAALNRLLWHPEGLSLVGWGDVAHLQQDGLDEISS
jgi:2,3-bisphosphoglycerate-dependent phosphoglycerate mutase